MKRVCAAEALGTALLVATVIGSGIMAERLSGGNAAVALLANTLATGAALYLLITLFAPISGAHFNPVVSALAAPRHEWLPRMAAQIAGATLGHHVAGWLLAAPSQPQESPTHESHHLA